MRDALLPITIPLSKLYSGLIRQRNARFDQGRGITQLNMPVISVGNITTGGVGKSPMVRWICDRLLEAGRMPMIAMRGYGSARGMEADEAIEHRSHFGDRVPVVANPDRASAIMQFLRDREQAVDCIVLDDGFQHRRIARDLDLVLIDASQSTLRSRMLPAGRLREPVANLARADAVIVTHGEGMTPALDAGIASHHDKPALAVCRHVWDSLALHHPGESEPEHAEPAWLDGKRLATCFGVGNPAAVQRLALLHGGVVRANVAARDHQKYDARFIARLREVCSDAIDALVVTPKDWAKLAPPQSAQDSWPVPIVVPNLHLTFDRGEDALRALILARTTGSGLNFDR